VRVAPVDRTPPIARRQTSRRDRDDEDRADVRTRRLHALLLEACGHDVATADLAYHGSAASLGYEAEASDRR
jgi:hypothetical protein